MTMPFYVTPEQQMKDRAEYAQKGIARGRSLIACIYDDGVLLVAENPSASLNKISEIYDRIGFAGVGKYNEFHELRSAGVRWADSTGFRYSREDVDARSLANVYAQYLGTSFTDGGKPLEVEVLVAQLAIRNKPTKIYHIAFEGTITDETRFAVLGGDSETIRTRFVSEGDDVTTLAITLQRAARALSGPERSIPPADLEVARLEDLGTRRTFNRLSDDFVGQLLA